MWTQGWRDRVWGELDRLWDVIIIGGGVTGAGVLRQAAENGLRALLVEADDFASGASSRSSKLVHGGLRYLKTAQIKLTFESVREREYLLQHGRGLVHPLAFLYVHRRNDPLPGWVFGLALCVYDIMARRWRHGSLSAHAVRERCPLLTAPDLKGGYCYFDAKTDDARLVLRLLREAVADGALALNHARVVGLLRTQKGRVRGVALRDVSGDAERTAEVRAKVVINATGAWVDELRGRIERPPRMRPLRGSHLIFPYERLPIPCAVGFLHPKDGRPVFALPWEGATLFGTTDVDHRTELNTDPAISEAEYEYLLTALQQIFPGQALSADDVLATFAGLRPVVNTGKADPSKESREHVVWDEDDMITVSGGKLTTFRLMAWDALKKAAKHLGAVHFDHRTPVLEPLPEQALSLLEEEALTPQQRLRLLAHYGPRVVPALLSAGPAELETIPGTPYVWGELRLAARYEGVVHLDDLLLRRLRLGLLLPNGGIDRLDRVRDIVQWELGWDDARWEQEIADYARLWRSAYRARL
ncbi:MAG: glycerol-3-phosphate dehydrogenase/oxidase [Chloroflexi bacterium]|nr:glycerol-3-phosphate dehydrogenase/oxidase [Chloroflexota bacterium]